MKTKEISQGEVARIIGMDRRNVNKTLRGTERGVSIEQLIRIANGIGLDVDVIIKRRKD
ncbi:MAG: helix-turn-helix domain-containing protein [Bdellovibrionales bacterium]|nr:helix-turn-helix domain-containing protein [Bdellovibrionales bacterium]